MSPALRVGAMFAGYGGLDEGVALALAEPTRVEWVAEFDDGPAQILAARYPHAPNLGDVTAVDWSAVAPVDIITGGSPCQDLSHAGKRAGMRAGTRSGLWSAMCDAVEIIRPALVVWENVRGALSAESTSAVEPCPLCVGDRPGVTMRALGRVLGDLAEIGYDATWCGLRAADVGAPHGRFRVFVVAWDAAAHPDRATRGERGLAAPGQTEGGRPRADAGRRGRAHGVDGPLLPTPAVNDMGAAYTPDEWDAWTERMKAAHGNGNGHGRSLEIEAARLLPTPNAADVGRERDLSHRSDAGSQMELGDTVRLLPSPRATDGTKGGPNQRGSSGDLMLPSAVLLPTPLVTTAKGSRWSTAPTGRKGDTLDDIRVKGTFGDYAPAIARWEAVLGREAPSPTEPTGRNGGARLSPRFVEWLMGLPDGWVTDVGLSRNAQLKALGNGVVPQQAAAAITHCLDIRATTYADLVGAESEGVTA